MYSPKHSNAEDPRDRFELLAKIGKGGYGYVCKARDTYTNTMVAIKIINLEDAGDEVEDVHQEIAVMSNMSCPQLTKYFSSYVIGINLWIIMEYLEAGSLLDILRESGPLPEPFVAYVMKELLHALVYLHSERKIHRDVKAGNLLVASDGSVKLADFGVTGQLTDSMDKRQTKIGTPFWMAPEVICQSSYDGCADIWSAGITAIELSKGAPPYANKIHPFQAILLIPKSPPPVLEGDEFSPEFKDFVSCCLIKNPAERPSAATLLNHPFIRNTAAAGANQEYNNDSNTAVASATSNTTAVYSATTSCDSPNTSRTDCNSTLTFSYSGPTTAQPPPIEWRDFVQTAMIAQRSRALSRSYDDVSVMTGGGVAGDRLSFGSTGGVGGIDGAAGGGIGLLSSSAEWDFTLRTNHHSRANSIQLRSCNNSFIANGGSTAAASLGSSSQSYGSSSLHQYSLTQQHRRHSLDSNRSRTPTIDNSGSSSYTHSPTTVMAGGGLDINRMRGLSNSDFGQSSSSNNNSDHGICIASLSSSDDDDDTSVVDGMRVNCYGDSDDNDDKDNSDDDGDSDCGDDSDSAVNGCRSSFGSSTGSCDTSNRNSNRRYSTNLNRSTNTTAIVSVTNDTSSHPHLSPFKNKYDHSKTHAIDAFNRSTSSSDNTNIYDDGGHSNHIDNTVISRTPKAVVKSQQQQSLSGSSTSSSINKKKGKSSGSTVKSSGSPRSSMHHNIPPLQLQQQQQHHGLSDATLVAAAAAFPTQYPPSSASKRRSSVPTSNSSSGNSVPPLVLGSSSNGSPTTLNKENISCHKNVTTLSPLAVGESAANNNIANNNSNSSGSSSTAVTPTTTRTPPSPTLAGISHLLPALSPLPSVLSPSSTVLPAVTVTAASSPPSIYIHRSKSSRASGSTNLHSQHDGAATAHNNHSHGTFVQQNSPRGMMLNGSLRSSSSDANMRPPSGLRIKSIDTYDDNSNIHSVVPTPVNSASHVNALRIMSPGSSLYNNNSHPNSSSNSSSSHHHRSNANSHGSTNIFSAKYKEEEAAAAALATAQAATVTAQAATAAAIAANDVLVGKLQLYQQNELLMVREIQQLRQENHRLRLAAAPYLTALNVLAAADAAYRAASVISSPKSPPNKAVAINNYINGIATAATATTTAVNDTISGGGSNNNNDINVYPDNIFSAISCTATLTTSVAAKHDTHSNINTVTLDNNSIITDNNKISSNTISSLPPIASHQVQQQSTQQQQQQQQLDDAHFVSYLQSLTKQLLKHNSNNNNNNQHTTVTVNAAMKIGPKVVESSSSSSSSSSSVLFHQVVIPTMLRLYSKLLPKHKTISPEAPTSSTCVTATVAAANYENNGCKFGKVGNSDSVATTTTTTEENDQNISSCVALLDVLVVALAALDTVNITATATAKPSSHNQSIASIYGNINSNSPIQQQCKSGNTVSTTKTNHITTTSLFDILTLLTAYLEDELVDNSGFAIAAASHNGKNNSKSQQQLMQPHHAQQQQSSSSLTSLSLSV